MMDTADRTLLAELCEKLAGGSWDAPEIATAATKIELAIDRPDLNRIMEISDRFKLNISRSC
jgi:hypothetical protein